MRTRSCVLRFAGGFVGAVLLLLLTPIAALAQYWLPGAAPTAHIDHWTWAFLPQDRTRTEIGIGERVQLDVSNYSDMDIYVDDLGFQYDWEDTLGRVEWTVDGPGEVWPFDRADPTFTAALWAQDTSATVSVVMHDTESMGLDPPITRSLSFTIRVPNGILVQFLADAPIGTPGPPIQSMGAQSYFNCWILPDTVNFYMASFQENMPDKLCNWPDGTQWLRPATIWPYDVSDYYSGGGDFDRPNYQTDRLSTGLHNPEHLKLLNVSPPVYDDCQWDVPVPHQFLSVNGWVTFRTLTHFLKFQGGDFQSQVKSEEWGGLQGPYTEPPRYP